MTKVQREGQCKTKIEIANYMQKIVRDAKKKTALNEVTEEKSAKKGEK